MNTTGNFLREKVSILLVHRIVCTDEEALNWRADDIGNLRLALNALVRVFRMRL
jgi:hypothetical protein